MKYTVTLWRSFLDKQIEPITIELPMILQNNINAMKVANAMFSKELFVPSLQLNTCVRGVVELKWMVEYVVFSMLLSAIFLSSWFY